MADNARFFFEEPTYDPKAVEKHVKNSGGIPFLKQIAAILTPVTAEQWNKTGLAEPMDRVHFGMRHVGVRDERAQHFLDLGDGGGAGVHDERANGHGRA